MKSDERVARRSFLVGSAGIAGAVALPAAASAQEEGISRDVYEVLVNQVGYEAAGPKRAIVAAWDPRRVPLFFSVLDRTGRTIHRGRTVPAGAVDDWQRDRFPEGPDHYWTADFTAVTAPGEYTLEVTGPGASGRSWPFRIEQNALERYTLSQVIHYFRDSRSDGQYDKADRHLAIPGTSRFWDAHGGWYDAAADWGKHFTQLSQLSYFNTLSIPLTAWVLFAAHGNLARRNDSNFAAALSWLLDEGFYGADFLARMHEPGLSFYGSIHQPEADDLSIDPTQRTMDANQMNFREGAGLAIAALARASTYGISGEYHPADYLAVAIDAFAYLQANNVALTNDGKENIQDDYNALLAATELAKATGDTQYLRAADARATSLLDRLASWRNYRDYWRADSADRPFFHPSDAGLPVVSLLTYFNIAPADMRTRIGAVVRRSLEFELAITGEVTNPFGYARQLIQGRAGNRYSGFFMPHDISRPGDFNWWQGENARIASLAAAARHAARMFSDGTIDTDAAFARKLADYAQNQIDWILGRNPFNVCMMEGPGRAVALYLEYADAVGSWRWLRSAGGIVNGVTGKGDDGRGLHWDPGLASTGPNTDWRWLEQWLPHSTWYLYAITVGALPVG
ncbi:glycoside hydrolase family 9 protein [Pendulispora brunnea]|uniref:Glycoside hydrolase family 9 protein n=1 Tax=Pendulispora brunnea TaxID=2905690 RepID=A0ABZ2JVD3_9BACT